MHKYKRMLSSCLKCRKNTEKINRKISGTSNGKTMILSNCAICGSKKSKCIKKQEASGLLNSLGIKTLLKQNSFISKFFVLKVILLNDLIVIITIL